MCRSLEIALQDKGFCTDVSYGADIAVSSIPFVSFADGFLDCDNDGWLDLLIVNGHVYPEADEHPDWGTSYAERPLLYHNQKDARFALVPAVAGRGLAVISVDRAASQRKSRPQLLGGTETCWGSQAPLRCVRSGGISGGGRHPSTGRLIEQWQSFLFERHADTLWLGRHHWCQDSRDSLVLGQKGICSVARDGANLHDHLSAGNHRCVACRQALCRSG